MYNEGFSGFLVFLLWLFFFFSGNDGICKADLLAAAADEAHHFLTIP